MLFKLLSDRNQIMQYNTCAMRASYIKAQSGIIIVTIQPDSLIYSKSVLCLLTTQLKQLIFCGLSFPTETNQLSASVKPLLSLPTGLPVDKNAPNQRQHQHQPVTCKP